MTHRNGGAQAPSTLNFDDPQPGIYDGVSSEVYHQLPLISASGLKIIDQECPAQFRYEIDNPDDGGTVETDIGTSAHLVYLEPEDFTRKVEPLNVDSYQTKKAREARDAARAEGKTPLRWKDYETVLAMRESLIRQVGDLFVGGKAERTYIWRDPRTGSLCKCRPDYTRPELLIDFKTTKSANPRAFRSRVFDNGHHIQAWWYLTAHELLTGERAAWRWVVQSTKPPYLVTAHRPTPGLLGWAEQQGRAALGIYAKCVAQGSWPGYGDVVWPVELPNWAMFQLQERMEAGDFKLEQTPARKKKPVKPVEVERAIAAFSPLNGGLTQ
jgi:PDDEXK-like domain of unknown function (DUF3799)